MPGENYSENERTWAALAHASTLLNLAAPGAGGIIASLIIYLSYKERSTWVAFHALQATLFQLLQLAAVIIIVGGSWVIGFIFSFVTIGFGALIAVPVMIITFFLGAVILLAGMIYGIYGAFQVNQGKDFIYFWAGKWAAQIMKPA
jgi:uncharacterized Tic20 family protein